MPLKGIKLIWSCTVFGYCKHILFSCIQDTLPTIDFARSTRLRQGIWFWLWLWLLDDINIIRPSADLATVSTASLDQKQIINTLFMRSIPLHHGDWLCIASRSFDHLMGLWRHCYFYEYDDKEGYGLAVISYFTNYSWAWWTIEWDRQDIGIEQVMAHCFIGRFRIGVHIKCY